MATQKKTMPKVASHAGMQNYGPVDPDFSTNVLKCQLEVAAMGDSKPQNTTELIEKINKYFEIVAKYHLPPTVEGLGLALNYHKNSLWDIENGNGRSDFSDIIKKAKNVIKNYDASMAVSGLIPTGVYTFRAKNWYGMHDQQEVVLAPKQELTPENASEIIKEIPDEI